MTEWQGDRHVSIAQKLSSLLNDHFIGTEQIKRIAEDTNRPPLVFHTFILSVQLYPYGDMRQVVFSLRAYVARLRCRRLS